MDGNKKENIFELIWKERTTLLGQKGSFFAIGVAERSKRVARSGHFLRGRRLYCGEILITILDESSSFLILSPLTRV